MSRLSVYDAAIDAAFELGKTDLAAARRAVLALGYDPNVIPVLASNRQKRGNTKNHDIHVMVARSRCTAVSDLPGRNTMI